MTGSLGTQRAFTLIELLVVMAMIGLLAAIAYPRFFSGIDKSREAVLRQDLFIMREALGHFYQDRSRYPEQLAELVDKHYLRRIPVDPITESAETWVIEPPRSGMAGNVGDVRSGAQGIASDGSRYAQW